MNKNSVDLHYDEYLSLIKKIDAGEISLLTSINDNYRKSLILCAASYFEKAVSEQIASLPGKKSKSSKLVIPFIENQGLKRKYHTLFGWDKANANSFFGLFGNDFKKFMEGKVTSDLALSKGIVAFLTIGEERNKMVHNDYGSYRLDKSTDEVYSQYKEAKYFVEKLSGFFKDFLK